MSRGRIFGMVLAGLVFWISPVLGASIQKSVDSQGVIRISNVKPRAAATPEAPAPSPAPLETPVAKSASPASDVAQSSSPGPILDSAASLNAAPPHETLAPDQAPPLPIKKAALATPELAVPAKDAPKEVTASEGGIRRYQDAQGIIHIENVAPEPPGIPAPLPQVTSPALAAAGPREGGSPEPGPPPGLLAIRKANWSDEMRPPGPSPQPAKEGAVRCYRDRRGVLHITNLAELEANPSRLAQGDEDSRRARDGPVLKLPTPAPALAAAPLEIARASLEEKAPLPERPPPLAPDPWVDSDAPGQIQRYRDAKGVLHLYTTEPEPPPWPWSPRSLPGSLWSQVLAGFSPPKAAVGAHPGAPAPPGGQVVAYKDGKGRLVIQNSYPQTQYGRGPPLQASPYLQAIILEAALAYQLPVPLIEAVIKVESNGVPWAVSPKGAMGLMQLMPGTAEFLGVQDPFCPRENVLAGCRYLRLLLDLFQDVPLAVAAYNAGYQRVINCGYRIPEIKETQDFVTQVLGRYQLAVNPVPRPTL